MLCDCRFQRALPGAASVGSEDVPEPLQQEPEVATRSMLATCHVKKKSHKVSRKCQEWNGTTYICCICTSANNGDWAAPGSALI